jgi:hypothetical protein
MHSSDKGLVLRSTTNRRPDFPAHLHRAYLHPQGSGQTSSLQLHRSASPAQQGAQRREGPRGIQVGVETNVQEQSVADGAQ